MEMTVLAKPRKPEARLIDPELGILEGEAAEQEVKSIRPKNEQALERVWPRMPTVPETPDTYYDLPLLKQPTWIWSVPLYFYFGGVAGGASILAGVLEFDGSKENRRLARRCKAFSFACTTIGAGLLTYDLGKPVRFVNMLRVFKPTSPMNVGSWILVRNSAASMVALLLPLLPSPLRRLRKPLALDLIITGTGLCGYTGVLLGNSTVPIWQVTRTMLPLLFTASAAATTAAAIEALALNETEEKTVKPFALVGKGAELAAMLMLEKQARRYPSVAKPLQGGKSGKLWQTGKILVAAGVAMNLVPGKSVTARRIGGALGTIGAVFLRFALMEAGKRSAADPRSTIHVQLQAEEYRDCEKSTGC